MIYFPPKKNSFAHHWLMMIAFLIGKIMCQKIFSNIDNEISFCDFGNSFVQNSKVSKMKVSAQQWEEEKKIFNKISTIIRWYWATNSTQNQRQFKRLYGNCSTDSSVIVSGNGHLIFCIFLLQRCKKDAKQNCRKDTKWEKRCKKQGNWMLRREKKVGSRIHWRLSAS